MIGDEKRIFVPNVKPLLHLKNAAVPLFFERLLCFVGQGKKLKLKEVLWLRILERSWFLTLVPYSREAVTQLVYVVRKIVMSSVEVANHNQNALFLLISEELKVDFKDRFQKLHI